MRQLYSVPAGLLAGIVLARLFPAGAHYVEWLGQIFIALLKLLKLLILPLILVSIFASLAGGDNLRQIGGRTPTDFHVPTRRRRAESLPGDVHRPAHHGLLRRYRRHPRWRHRHDGLHARPARPAADLSGLVSDRRPLFDYPITAINVWGDLVVAAIVDRETRED